MKKIDITKIIRKDIAVMESYIPGTSIYDLGKKYKQKPLEIIKLNANENPYGPSPRVIKALNNTVLHYYPDSTYKYLRNEIGKYCKVNSENIIVGTGSDEIIDLLLRIVLNDGDKVINCPPTFSMYSCYASLNKGKIIEIQTDQNFRIKMNEIIKACKDEKVKIVFLCNPNNPTGTIFDPEEIIPILETGKLIVVDEAYFEFCNITAIPLLEKYENLVILRSFSKWAGLAGLRLGYGIMSPKLVNEIMKVKSPFSPNIAAESAAIATIEDLSFSKNIIKNILKDREVLYNKLSKINKIKVFRSYANFIFVQMGDEYYGILREKFEENKIAFRYFPKLNNGIRITVGKPEQNNKIINVFNEVFNKNKYVFLDRDGTLIFEPQDTFQIDSIEKLEILDGVIKGLKDLTKKGYDLIMISNQDGLGTASFPKKDFEAPQNKMLSIFSKYGIKFKKIFICSHLPSENCDCRKPKLGLVKNFLKNNQINKKNSFVCGDRETDKQFARNLGIKFISMPTNGNFYNAIVKGGVLN